MAEQAQKQRERNTGTAQEAPVKKTTDETGEKEKKDVPDVEKLIKDIDDVLEEDAEEFVKNYVQQGGE